MNSTITPTSFTDPVLTPNVTKGRVEHINELRTAISNLQILAPNVQNCGFNACQSCQTTPCQTCQSATCQTCQSCQVCCFSPDTPILMSCGSVKRIADIKVGDLVCSWDTQASKIIHSVVKSLVVSVRDTLYTVKFANGLELRLTCDHPIYGPTGWLSIDPVYTMGAYKIETTELSIGSVVISHDCVTTSVVSIKREPWYKETYTFEVDSDEHNYIANGFVAHNPCTCGC